MPNILSNIASPLPRLSTSSCIVIMCLNTDKKSKLSIRLREIEMEDEEEIMEGYFNKGLTEISELTEYYKYYTQTSILHQ